MSSNSLRPAWKGRGFQPPPQVASERSRSQSMGAAEDNPKSGSFNKFAALDDDDDVVAAAAGEETSQQQQLPVHTNSRSEGLRSKSVGERTKSGGGGRSLADLAARVPERQPSGAGRFGGLANRGGTEEKVVRYTREKLLSMRPQPKEVPDFMKPLDGSVILADGPQDPVCFDDLDAEAIWATIPRRAPKALPEGAEPRRLSSRRDPGASSGRWQRGVALPPTDKQKRDKDADNPNDLWDDPIASTTGAATDFSAFGALPDEKEEDEPFDFEKMAAASAKLEEELHARSRASSDVEDEELENAHSVKVDAARPLASQGTTIRAGSGDDVNVFEDFDEPGSEPEEPPAIKSAAEDPSASSRLMAMIGVKKEEPESTSAAPAASSEPKGLAWGASGGPAPANAPIEGPALSLNPWGDPILGAPEEKNEGLDLQSRLREAEIEQQKAREAEIRQRQEEEAKRIALAKQQAERQQAQAAAMQQQQQQQQHGVQSQVELVLMERISTILENSWGRSDLMSILSTLHAEDSRVIPLLNNVDALRALLLRNPGRVAVQHDNSFGAEMAVLLMSNAQWQQQQQAEARAQQEEMQRREHQRQMEEQQKAARSQSGQQSIVPGAPWYYSDPQRNIQGPFRGEEMRQWLEAGYFKGDLPISQSATGPFHPLSSVFPDLSMAFSSESGGSAEEEARAKAEQEEKERLEAERATAEAEAAERERERERRAKEAAEDAERAEKERRQKEAVEAARRAEQERRAKEKGSKSKNGGNESSAQLKMMLGVSTQGNGEPGSGGQQADGPAPKVSEKRPSKSSNKKNNKDSHAAPEQPSAKPTAPAWGGASQSAAKKSMSEIQKEEARIAALQAMNQQGSRSSSSGWANVAASKGGSSGWSGGSAKQVPAAVITGPAAGAPAPIQTRSKSVPSKTGPANSKPAAQTQRNTSTSSSVAEEFGAKMSPALEKWCKDQMLKLNGTDDITLAAFCMSLDDPSEVRQYLTAYLGSTPQVNGFATEFINRKGGNKKQQEEWETTGTTKKKGKKKTGGR